MIRMSAAIFAVLLSGAVSQSDIRPPFDADIRPTAPDYRDRSAWAALPDQLNAAGRAPGGSTLAVSDQRMAKADVFYVHPTTELSKLHWNQDLREADTNSWTDNSVMARQGGVFGSCCRIYAPRYRQAAPGSVGSSNGSGQKAFDLAYDDVKRAFLYYLAHYNQGRPFILAGHSQGSLHIDRLLEEMVDGKPLQRQLVAAYTPGIPIALGEFGRRYTSLTACDTPTATQCIASWNAFEALGAPALYRRDAQAKYRVKYAGGDATSLCVNPLTFDLTKPVAPASANLGALPGRPSPDPLPPLVPGALGAKCENGILMVDEPHDLAFALHRLPAGSLHYQEFDLFYANISRNAVDRVAAFVATTKRPLKVPKNRALF